MITLNSIKKGDYHVRTPVLGCLLIMLITLFSWCGVQPALANDNNLSTQIQYLAPLDNNGNTATSNKSSAANNTNKSFNPFHGTTYVPNKNDSLNNNAIKISEQAFDKNATIQSLGQHILNQLNFILNWLMRIALIICTISLLISIIMFAFSFFFRRLRWTGFVAIFYSLCSLAFLGGFSKLVSIALNFLT